MTQDFIDYVEAAERKAFEKVLGFYPEDLTHIPRKTLERIKDELEKLIREYKPKQ